MSIAVAAERIISGVLAPTPPPVARPGLHLIVGPYEIQSVVLYSLVPILDRGTTVYWIDAGNWFDAYGVSVAARARQIDARAVLDRIRLARPFTAIQLTAMLTKLLPDVPPSCPVILSDPMGLFYDHELPESDLQRIFRDFVEAVRGLSRPVLTLGVSRVPKNPERRSLSKRLLKEVRSVAYVSKERPGVYERLLGRPMKAIPPRGGRYHHG